MIQKRTSRRRRRLLVVAGALALVVLVVAVVVRTPSNVGHWRSGSGHDAYVEAYDAAMAELPAPEETLDVRTSYGVVRVYRFAATGGDPAADPIVLLPGRSSGTPVWAANLPSLREITDVYALDLLGEPGLSIQDRPIEDDDDQAAWLDEVLDALPEDAFSIVGLSIGGWTAANLATRRPDRIASLTLIEPVLVFDDLPLEAVLRSIPASIPWLPTSWRDSFGSWTAGGAPTEDVPVTRMIESGMQNYALSLPAPTRIPAEAVGSLGMPVLVVLAGDSVMHDSEESRATAEDLLPDGTVIVIPGASHAVNGEHPAEVAEAIGMLLAVDG